MLSLVVCGSHKIVAGYHPVFPGVIMSRSAWNISYYFGNRLFLEFSWIELGSSNFTVHGCEYEPHITVFLHSHT